MVVASEKAANRRDTWARNPDGLFSTNIERFGLNSGFG
jgi:hypothetical protein